MEGFQEHPLHDSIMECYAQYFVLALVVLATFCDAFGNVAPVVGASRQQALLMAVTPRSSRETETRAIASVASVTSIATSLFVSSSKKASAFDFFPSKEQQDVDAVSAFQKPVYEVLNQLRPYDTPNALGVYSKQQLLKGGQDDSNVVLLYLINYITPLQTKMAEVAGGLKLEGSSQERVELLPKLMLGHTLELKAAVKSLKAEEQLKEVEEVWETLQEFLKLSSSKYKVTQYVDVKQISDADLYGPFGCGFYGKKRAEGSNACVDPAEASK